MKKCLILLAGYPATGKSYMCRKILDRYPQFKTINQDEIKEQIWDQFGFDNMQEKEAQEQQAWAEYYRQIEEGMGKGEFIISDYPFSVKQKGRLESLAEKYDYQVITIRLTGDIDKLYQNSHRRDMEQSRHLGHLVSKYHKGDVLLDRSKADCLVTYDIFRERCLTRGYDKFQLGQLIQVDVSDFYKIDYEQILSDIGRMCEES